MSHSLIVIHISHTYIHIHAHIHAFIYIYMIADEVTVAKDIHLSFGYYA